MYQKQISMLDNLWKISNIFFFLFFNSGLSKIDVCNIALFGAHWLYDDTITVDF